MFLHLALTFSIIGLSLGGLFRQPARVPENTYETCSLKLDRGDACCPRPNNTIRFFFDPELELCLSYLYEGCGGGRNTFYTDYECRTTCIPADKFTCGANVQPTGSCSDLDQSCPAGSSCVVGFGGGLC
ncbi:Kunitz/Bovine pancreatic trypsin inhibitor domain protein, partial [Trichostrongylus colubriformis]